MQKTILTIKAITILLALSFFNGKITFGYGLGDFVHWIIYIISFVLFFILSRLFKAKEAYIKLILSLWILTLISFVLLVTVFRGAEYPWNGNLFY